MEELTFERAVELAEEIIREFGADYVYPVEHKREDPDTGRMTCVYVHEEKPSCFVGQILFRFGVSTDGLARYEFDGASLVANRFVSIDYPTSEFLDELQSSQDSGKTWSASLEDALKLTRHLVD